MAWKSIRLTAVFVVITFQGFLDAPNTTNKELVCAQESGNPHDP